MYMFPGPRARILAPRSAPLVRATTGLDKGVKGAEVFRYSPHVHLSICIYEGIYTYIYICMYIYIQIDRKIER
jgi:hypothetical protein